MDSGAHRRAPTFPRPRGESMSNLFGRIIGWLGGNAAKRHRRPTKSRWEGIPTEARRTTSIQTDNAPPMPFGARFRPQSSGYTISMAQMEQISQGLRDLPPLPQGAMEVMRELDSEQASAATVAEAIGREPVMAASILRIANSSAMGLRREVASVSEAVAYLGFSMTKSLFLRLNMTALLPDLPGGAGYDSEKLWVHSMAVSQASEEIARRAGGADIQLALTAGLLHDIGRLAINRKHPQDVARLWSEAHDPNESLLDRERRLFGADHAFIGSALASEWKLPHDLIEIIRLHHLPADQPANLPSTVRRALLSVFIANQLVKFRHLYCKGMEIDEVSAAVTDELGLPAWPQLLSDDRLIRMIDRAIRLNGGASATAIAAKAPVPMSALGQNISGRFNR
jgi:putative nucleotidyltransferase with HDIG domain